MEPTVNYQPNQAGNVIYDVHNSEILQNIMPDSLMEKAQEIGMVSSMNNMNYEGRQQDQILREEHEIYEDHPLLPGIQQDVPHEMDRYPDQEQIEEEFEPQTKDKAPRKKKKVDKRFDDLTYRLATKDEELRYKDEEIRRLHSLNEMERQRLKDEHEASMLAVHLATQKEKLANDIERVSNVMYEAKEGDDTKLYVDANRLLNKLMAQEVENDSTIQQLQHNYQQSKYNNPDYSEINNLAEQKFLELSDKKEINSPVYSEWLRRNDHCNPYHENFDADLAYDVANVKKDFNKFLKFNRRADYIATPEYYSELDAIMSQKYNIGNYIPQHPARNQPQSNYSQNGYEQNNYSQEGPSMRHTIHINPEYDESLEGDRVPEGQVRRHSSEPDMYPRKQTRPVAPVSRQGYSSQVQSNRLPPLSKTQRDFALMMKAVDPMDPSRQLNDSEKIYNYQMELVRMAQGR